MIKAFLGIFAPWRGREEVISGADGGDPWCEGCEAFHPRTETPCNEVVPAANLAETYEEVVWHVDQAAETLAAAFRPAIQAFLNGINNR